MRNRSIIMAKNTNAFGKLTDEVYASHAPGKPENVGYMKSMPPKRKGKKRPKTTVRQNEALKQANERVSAVLKDPVLKRVIDISYEGNIKFVMWNSGPDFSALGESDDPDYGRHFLCVEGATLYRDRAYTLAPGASHTLKAIIAVRTLD